MINFKREYIGLEQDRLLYPVSFKDKAKCNVYGRKKFITEAGEVQLSAHVFLISKDFWTFNAGQLDFTNYPNGIWNDYISIDIIEKDEYTAPSINFGSMGDITPENLQGLSDYISKHLSDLEKRIVEDYLFIDEGVSENIELPNLPENHFWARRNGVIVGVNLDYLKADYEHFKNELWKNYESFNEKLQAALKKYYDDLELQMNNFFKDLIEKIREEAEKQLGLIAGAGGGLLHKIDQANHGFIFDPIVYENGVWKKATTTSGVDGIGVVISSNTFFFLEAGEIEIPQGATDKDGQPLLDDEYYYMNEDGGTGFQKEEPVWFYQPLFHTRTYKGKLLANVHIDTMEDLRGQVVDTESGRTHGIALWGDIVPKFDTIEKLQKAFWLKEGEVVEVLGYYSAGDGAGHKRIIASEDDGSGVQLSNNLWACIVHNGEVNVSWFGAKGDGVTDDTEIFNKCSGYDVVNCNKDKIYLINAKIHDCFIRGGKFKSFDKNQPVFTCGSNTRIENSEIYSELGNYGNFARGIYFENADNISLKNIDIHNISRAVILLVSCTNGVFENINMHDCGSEVSTTTMIEILGNCSNHKFTNIKLRDWNGESILVRGASRISFDNIKANGKKGNGCIFTLETSHDINCNNIEIEDSNHSGIELNDCYNIEINNSTVKNCIDYCLLVSTFRSDGKKSGSKNISVRNLNLNGKTLIVSSDVILENIASTNDITISVDGAKNSNVTLINSEFSKFTATGTSENKVYIKDSNIEHPWNFNNSGAVRITDINGIVKIKKAKTLRTGEELTLSAALGLAYKPTTAMSVKIFSAFKEDVRNQSSFTEYYILNNTVKEISEISTSIPRKMSLISNGETISITNNTGVDCNISLLLEIIL